MCFLFFTSVLAQKEKDSTFMKLHLKFDGQTLVLNKTYLSKKSDTLEINVLKFYISDIEIRYDDDSTFKPKKKYHLVDLDNSKTHQIALNAKADIRITQLSFAIGVDSTASVSGALADDLDATNGMYWAWQSGFINMKIEGKSNSCKTRKNQFHFHIGGYKKPFVTSRRVTLYLKNQNLDVVFELGELFAQVSLSEIHSIMIPNKKAVEFADIISQLFRSE
jgi:hypothetical protein